MFSDVDVGTSVQIDLLAGNKNNSPSVCEGIYFRRSRKRRSTFLPYLGVTKNFSASINASVSKNRMMIIRKDGPRRLQITDAQLLRLVAHL
jgi:hypothetical protein